MRRCLLFAVVMLLAGCGNKGPLVRPPGYSVAPATSAPAAATSVPVPAPASTASKYQP